MNRSLATRLVSIIRFDGWMICKVRIIFSPSGGKFVQDWPPDGEKIEPVEMV
jgi:hypothetical protein